SSAARMVSRRRFSWVPAAGTSGGWLLPAHHGDALNFDQDAGPGKSADRDQRARREALLECFLADLGKTVAVAHVVDEHGHRHHVPEPAAADGLDVLVELGKDLPGLALEIGAGITGLTAEPERLSALGDHGARERALLRARIGRKALFGAGGCG